MKTQLSVANNPYVYIVSLLCQKVILQLSITCSVLGTHKSLLYRNKDSVIHLFLLISTFCTCVYLSIHFVFASKFAPEGI